MNHWPETETALVQRLADPSDDQAWLRFDALYRPVVYRYARANGLQHADAEILVGEVMARVFRAAGRWTKRQGESESAGSADHHAARQVGPRPRRFRAWLRTVSQRALLNLVTRQLSSRGTGGTSHQLSVAGRPMPDAPSLKRWEQEHQRQIFMTAAGQIRSRVSPEHWMLFWQTHVDGISIEQAARQSGKSIGSIYAIRSRVLKRLRECVDRLMTLDEPMPGEQSHE